MSGGVMEFKDRGQTPAGGCGCGGEAGIRPVLEVCLHPRCHGNSRAVPPAPSCCQRRRAELVRGDRRPLSWSAEAGPVGSCLLASGSISRHHMWRSFAGSPARPSPPGGAGGRESDAASAGSVCQLPHTSSSKHQSSAKINGAAQADSCRPPVDGCGAEAHVHHIHLQTIHLI